MNNKICKKTGFFVAVFSMILLLITNVLVFNSMKKQVNQVKELNTDIVSSESNTNTLASENISLPTITGIGTVSNKNTGGDDDRFRYSTLNVTSTLSKGTKNGTYKLGFTWKISPKSGESHIGISSSEKYQDLTVSVNGSSSWTYSSLQVHKGGSVTKTIDNVTLKTNATNTIKFEFLGARSVLPSAGHDWYKRCEVSFYLSDKTPIGIKSDYYTGLENIKGDSTSATITRGKEQNLTDMLDDMTGHLCEQFKISDNQFYKPTFGTPKFLGWTIGEEDGEPAVIEETKDTFNTRDKDSYRVLGVFKMTVSNPLGKTLSLTVNPNVTKEELQSAITAKNVDSKKYGGYDLSIKTVKTAHQAHINGTRSEDSVIYDMGQHMYDLGFRYVINGTVLSSPVITDYEPLLNKGQSVNKIELKGNIINTKYKKGMIKIGELSPIISIPNSMITKAITPIGNTLTKTGDIYEPNVSSLDTTIYQMSEYMYNAGFRYYINDKMWYEKSITYKHLIENNNHINSISVRTDKKTQGNYKDKYISYGTDCVKGISDSLAKSLVSTSSALKLTNGYYYPTIDVVKNSNTSIFACTEMVGKDYLFKLSQPAGSGTEEKVIYTRTISYNTLYVGENKVSLVFRNKDKEYQTLATFNGTIIKDIYSTVFDSSRTDDFLNKFVNNIDTSSIKEEMTKIKKETKFLYLGSLKNDTTLSIDDIRNVVSTSHLYLPNESIQMYYKPINNDGDRVDFIEKTNGIVDAVGEYKVIMKDDYGKEVTLNFFKISVDTYKNFDKITNDTYLKGEYYTVNIKNDTRINITKEFTIPKQSELYGTSNKYHGTYSIDNIFVFDSYENAKEFVKEVEETRWVTKNGETYCYTNYTGVSRCGLSKESVVADIDNTMTRKTFVDNFITQIKFEPQNKGKELSDRYVILDSAVRDNKTTKSIKDNNVYFISDTFKFEEYMYVSSIERQYSFSIIKKITMTNVNSLKTTEIEFGKELSSQIENINGVYQVVETLNDSLSTSKTYYVYIDKIAPTVKISYNKGIETQEVQIGIDNPVFKGHKFKITSVVDEDEFTQIKIVKGRSEYIYSNTSDANTFTFQTGATYQIYVYDRSNNVTSFTLKIAGEEPSLKTQEVYRGSEKFLKVKLIVPLDVVIKNIKVTYIDEVITKDANGKDIEFSLRTNEVVEFSEGGKYIFEITDDFGRTITINYIFKKDVPNINTNIKGDLTNKDVVITVANNATVEILYKKDASDEYQKKSVQGIPQGQDIKYVIKANDSENGYYKVKAYFESAPKNTNEIYFEIDTIPPELEFVTKDTETYIDINDTNTDFYDDVKKTNEQFYVKVKGDEEIKSFYVEYPIGGGTSKIKDFVAKEHGVYKFEVTDKAGNTRKYELALDIKVDLDIVYTNDKFIDEVGVESVTSWIDGYPIATRQTVVTASSGFIIKNRESGIVTSVKYYSNDNPNEGIIVEDNDFSKAGKYVVVSYDKMNNFRTDVILVIKDVQGYKILDTQSNVLQNNAKIKNGYTINLENNNIIDKISIKNNRTTITGQADKLYQMDGVNTIEIIDKLGNKAVINIEIDNVVEYSIVGTNKEIEELGEDGKNIKLYSNFVIKEIENLKSVDITLNGEKQEYQINKQFDENGLYKVVLTDKLDNVEVVYLKVYNKLEHFVIKDIKSNIIESGASVSGGFYMYWEDDSYISKVSYTRDHSYSAPYNQRDEITKDGVYTIVITDILGAKYEKTITIDNQVHYEIEYDKKYDTPESLFDNKSINKVLTKGFTITSEEDLVIKLVNEDEETIIINKGEIFKTDGVYKVILIDSLNNESLEYIEVRNQVMYYNANESGRYNTNLSVTWNDNAYVYSAKFKYNNGSEKSIYNNTIFQKEGVYDIVLTDRVGNIKTFKYEIDKTVSYSINADNYQIPKQENSFFAKSFNITQNKDNLENITIKVKYNNEFIPYSLGEELTNLGTYTAIITDDIGNEIEINVILTNIENEVNFINEQGEPLNGDLVKENFKVEYNELYISKLEYSSGNSFKPYYSESVFTNNAVYTFRITSVFNETVEYEVVYDNKVDYELKGKFIENETLLTRSFSITMNEDGQFLIKKDKQVYEYVYGDLISESGVYEICMTDNYNNVQNITIIVDTTPPEIILSEQDVTNKDVTVTIKDTSNIKTINVIKDKNSCDVTLDGNNQFILSEHGKYKINVIDVLGNESTEEIVIDKIVNYTSNIPHNDSYINGNIEINSNEELTVVAKLNGVEFEYVLGNPIKDAGEYEFILTDKVGNTISISAYKIASHKEYNHFKFKEKDIVSISKDGEEYEYILDTDGYVELYIDGEYLIECGDYEFKIIIDTIKPDINLSKKVKNGEIGNSVDLKQEFNVVYEVYYNGELLEEIPKRIDDFGSYKIIATDLAGNESVVEFNLIRKLNGASITLIVVASIIGGSLIGYVIYVWVKQLLLHRKVKNKKIRNKKKSKKTK